jgi:hypothetical protein
MAHIHNAILRGYNSIYLQAPHVAQENKPAFVGYALTWYKFVKGHHDDEEGGLFPAVAGVLGVVDADLWREMYEEHEAFLEGLGKYRECLEGLETPGGFDGEKLREVMEGFREPFEAHFHSEIGTIASFAELPGAPAEGSEREREAAAIFKAWGKKTIMTAGIADVAPFFLMNLDATYEEERWADRPPIPPPVRWGLINIAGSWNWSWWKFASCDSSGQPQQLYASVDGGTQQDM